MSTGLYPISQLNRDIWPWKEYFGLYSMKWYYNVKFSQNEENLFVVVLKIHDTKSSEDSTSWNWIQRKYTLHKMNEKIIVP